MTRISVTDDEQMIRNETIWLIRNVYKKVQADQLNVLVVDDDPDVLDLVAEMFERLGYRTNQACGINHALQLFEHFRYDLVVTDFNMLDGNGYRLSEIMKSKLPDTKVVIMTGSGIQVIQSNKSEDIVDAWIFKPFGFNEILNTLAGLAF